VVSVCNVRCMAPEEGISPAPLLQTLLSFPLHPLPENFLLHLLPPKRLHSLVSILRVIASSLDARSSVFFLFVVQIILVDLNLLDLDLIFVVVFSFPLPSRPPSTSRAPSNIDIDPWGNGESERLGNLSQIQGVHVENPLERVRSV